MASKGSLKLKSVSLLDLYNTINGYQSTAEDALYDQYKSAYKLSVTNHMRGQAADSFKTYFSQGTVNMISGIMDIVSEMTVFAQLLTESFYQYESASNGVVAESQLKQIKTDLDGYETTYNGMETELSQAIAEAAKYISTTDIHWSDVTDSYTDARSKLDTIRDDMYSVDDSALTSVEELLTRITNLSSMVTSTMNHCYKDGNFMPGNIASLPKQSWYEKQSNLALSVKLQEDPFAYEAGAVTVAENQWAKGLCSDVYAYAGYSFLGASGEAGIENGSAFAKGSAAVLALNGYAQLTDYIKAEGDAKVLYAKGDAKTGAGNGYFGAHLEAEAGVLKVNGKATIGVDEFNGYVKGDVKVLCADGKVAAEFDSKSGEYAIGVDASATLASAKGGVGVSLWDYEFDDGSNTATGKQKDSFFKLEASAKADAGGSFALYSESKKGIETPIANINATSLKIDASALIGFELNVTVPTVYLRWPW